MGSRGKFIDALNDDFTFNEDGQKYVTVGWIDDIEVIKVLGNESVKAPEYSHTENRIYAVIQNGKLKHISFYDENHKQVKCIDLLHSHNGYNPHYHINLNHKTGYPITDDDLKIINKIKMGCGLSD